MTPDENVSTFLLMINQMIYLAAEVSNVDRVRSIFNGIEINLQYVTSITDRCSILERFLTNFLVNRFAKYSLDSYWDLLCEWLQKDQSDADKIDKNKVLILEDIWENGALVWKWQQIATMPEEHVQYLDLSHFQILYFWYPLRYRKYALDKLRCSSFKSYMEFFLEKTNVDEILSLLVPGPKTNVIEFILREYVQLQNDQTQLTIENSTKQYIKRESKHKRNESKHRRTASEPQKNEEKPKKRRSLFDRLFSK
eukprot:78114_1